MKELLAYFERIEQLDQKVTPGPWEVMGREIESNGSYEEVITTEVDCSSYCYGGRGGGVLEEADAQFIAEARTLLPQLARALKEVLELDPITTNRSDFADGYNLALKLVRAVLTEALGDNT